MRNYFFLFLTCVYLNCLSLQRDKDILVHTNLGIENKGICELELSLSDCLKLARAQEEIFIILNPIKSTKNLDLVENGCHEFIFFKAFSGNYLKVNECNLKKKLKVSYEYIPSDEIIIFHAMESSFSINPILEFYNNLIASNYLPAPWYYYHNFKGEFAVIKISELEKYLNGEFKNE